METAEIIKLLKTERAHAELDRSQCDTQHDRNYYEGQIDLINELIGKIENSGGHK